MAQQGLAALTAFGGPISASAFQHYLDASGTYLPLPVDGLLTTNPALVTELNGVLVDAAADAVSRAAASATCTTVPFSSGWLPHADVADADWRYTLGRFFVQVLGTATRDPAATGVSVSYRVAVGDTYDFDPGSTFAEFGRLAADGRAADFLVGGLTTVRTAVVARAADLASPGYG